MTRLFIPIAAALIAAAAPAFAADDAAAQFEKAPAPPPTLAAAAAAVKPASGGEPRLQAPAYDAAADRVTKGATAAAMTATQQQLDPGGLNVDMQRLQSDPAYAAQFRGKVEAMTPAEKMAFGQRMAAAQRASALGQTPGQTAARGRALSTLGQNGPEDRKALASVHSILEGALRDAAARHAAVDKKIDAAAKACPADKTGWPLASCTGALGKKGADEHRAVETQALADENAAYRKARALAKARVDALAPLLAQAAAGGRSSDVSALSANIGVFTRTLLDFARTSALRSGFWAGQVATAYRGGESYFLKAGADREIRWPPDAASAK